MSILFESLVFGPISSRRLGKSLGVNLMPEIGKICSFDCIYCECGWNPENKRTNKLPKKEVYEITLEERLKELVGTEMEPDSITFSGNGEPTLHPDFAEIIDITLRLRNQYIPNAKISVLTNGPLEMTQAINCFGNFAMIGSDANSSGSSWNPIDKK